MFLQSDQRPHRVKIGHFRSISGEPWLAGDIAGIVWPGISPITLLACGAVLVLSLVHYHSLRLGQGVQNGLTAFKLGFILLFIVLGLWLGQGDLGHLTETRPDAAGTAASFAVALIFVSFAYSGWNAAAYLGSEIREPGRNLPRALVFGTLLVTALYLLLNLVYLYALPPAAMSGVLEVGTGAAAALFGPGIGQAFGLLIALGLLSVISAMVMAGPRVYFAMGRDGLFIRGIAEVHATRATPARAILLQAGIAMLMILVAAYDVLLIYIGFTLSLSAMLTVLGLIRLRRRRPDLIRPYRALGYPFTPLFFIAGNLWIVLYTLVSQPLVGLYGLATLAVGGLLYWRLRTARLKADVGLESDAGERSRRDRIARYPFGRQPHRPRGAGRSHQRLVG